MPFNSIDEPVELLFAKLNSVHLIVCFMERRFDELQSRLARTLERLEESGAEHRPWTGTALAITDLTGPTDNGWLIHHRTGKESVFGEEYAEMYERLTYRERALSVAQSYELFETFLYDTTAHLVLANEKYQSSGSFGNLNSASDGNSIDAWKSVVRVKYRGKANAKLINRLRRVAPDLKQAESRSTNNRRINMVDWYEVVGAVRHAVTHSDHIVKTEKTRSFTKDQASILKHNFPGVEQETGWLLQLRNSDAKFALQLFAEYAFAIYKALSLNHNYPWRHLLEMDRDA